MAGELRSPVEVIMESVGEYLLRLLPDTTFGGPEKRDDVSKPGRFVWYPDGESQLGSPKRIGGGPGDEAPIMTRTWGLSVVVWGKTLALTEHLVNTLHGVIHKLLSQHGYALAKEVWDGGGKTSRGVVCVVLLQLQMPVPRLQPQTKVITAINPTYELPEQPIP